MTDQPGGGRPNRIWEYTLGWATLMGLAAAVAQFLAAEEPMALLLRSLLIAVIGWLALLAIFALVYLRNRSLVIKAGWGVLIAVLFAGLGFAVGAFLINQDVQPQECEGPSCPPTSPPPIPSASASASSSVKISVVCLKKPPSQLRRGAVIELQYRVVSSTALSVGVGAGLYDDAGDDHSTGEGDIDAEPLDVGANTITRDFVIPKNLAPGSYEVTEEVWPANQIGATGVETLADIPCGMVEVLPN